MPRLPVMVALAAAVAVVLAGCGGASIDPADSGQSGVVPPALDSDPAAVADLGPLPETSGKVSAAGDLCRVVNADVARQALGFDGEIQAVPVEDLIPTGGIDACRYDGQIGDRLSGVVVTVRKIDDSAWASTVRDAELSDGGLVPAAGADEAVFLESDFQAAVRVDDSQGTALNPRRPNFGKPGVIRLATVAAQAAA